MKAPLTHLIAIVLCSSCLSASPQTSSHEEDVVRMAYGKLAYLTRSTVYSNASIDPHERRAISSPELDRMLRKSTVSYTLDDFKAGPISEIAGNRWGDTISAPLPSDRAISVSIATQSCQDSNLPQAEWKTAEADWSKPDPVSDEVRAKLLSMTVLQILALGGRSLTYPDVKYTRYASFQVTASFRGESLGPYKAIFFFGTNSKGQEVAGPVDLYADQTSLYRAVVESFYPAGLFQTHLREAPVLATWLNANQMALNACSPSKGDLCCSKTQCGISQRDLQRDMGTALVPLK